MFAVRAAACKALLNHETNQMRTKDLYSELLVQLSCSRSIRDAEARFIPPPQAASCLIAMFNPTPEQVWKKKEKKTENEEEEGAGGN